MPSLAQIIVRSRAIAAGRRTDPHVNPVLDAGYTLEALYPHCLRFAIGRDLRNGGEPQDYARNVNVPFVNGIGTLPDSVLREYIGSSYMADEKYSSYVTYPDFQRHRFNNLSAYYAMHGGSLYSTREAAPQRIPIRDQGVVDIANNDNFVNSSTFGVSADDVGKRATLIDDGAIIFDSFIDSYETDEFFIRGHALAAGSNGDLYVYRSDHYTYESTETGVTTTLNVQYVTCPNRTFTSADIGKRMTVVSAAGAYIVDAIITGILGVNTVGLSAKAMAAAVATATATIHTSDFILGTVLCEATAGSRVITTSEVPNPDFLNQRVYLYNSAVGLCVDAIIGTIKTSTTYNLQATAGMSTPGPTLGIVYRADHYGKIKEADDLTTNLGTSTVTSAALGSVATDTDLRLTAYKSGVLVVDAFIFGPSGADYIINGRPLTTNTNCDVIISSPGIRLNIPALPDVPILSTDELGITPKLADDVIVVMAGALTGEIKIKDLLEYR